MTYYFLDCFFDGGLQGQPKHVRTPQLYLICQQARPPLQRKKEGQETKQLKCSLSSKDLRLRQNYIINKDNAYTSMQGQFTEIASKPEFNRFISSKKSPVTKNEQLIAKQIVRYHQERRRESNGVKNRLRQRILFTKMRRPQHNSPMKRTIKELDTQSTRTVGEQIPLKKERTALTYVQSQEDNTMMLKQLVTRLQDSRTGRVMRSDPYTQRSKQKYYVAEALKNYLDKQSSIRDHLFNSIYFLQLLVQYNNTPNFAQDKPIHLPQHPKYKDKITVVFDLDQTLVHCFEQLSQKHEVQIPVTFPGGHSMLAPVNIRPYARQILHQLVDEFQLMVFTASHESYANAVINYLDPKRNLIQHRLFRRHCDYIEQGYYIKDLRILGRDLSRVVIVDNAAYSYAFQVSNGIPITSYYEGDSDFELRALKDYIFSLKDYPDVRVCNENTFKLSKYTTYATVQQLVQELYLEK